MMVTVHIKFEGVEVAEASNSSTDVRLSAEDVKKPKIGIPMIKSNHQFDIPSLPIRVR